MAVDKPGMLRKKTVSELSVIFITDQPEDQMILWLGEGRIWRKIPNF